MINLYKGDNLDVIKKMIEKGHKYNIIYLDPPYNTKNGDLIYNDNRGDSSSWKDYFVSRLALIKNVLQKNAVIYVSIGHEEIANAKISLDEVFGKKSFVAIMPRMTNNVAKTTKTISRINDFLIVYKIGNVEFNGPSIDTEAYKMQDEHFAKRGNYFLRPLAYKDFSYSENMDFEVKIGKDSFYPNSKETFTKRKSGDHNSKDWCWLWSKNKVDFAIKNDYIVAVNGRLFKKTYTKCEIVKKDNEYEIEYFTRTKPYTSLELADKKYSNTANKTDLEKLFSYPKSDSLLEFLFKLPKFGEKYILDPFAGTGTSGIVANKLDIPCDLIQISEKTPEKSKLRAEGFEDIFDLTKENLNEKGVEVQTHE